MSRPIEIVLRKVVVVCGTLAAATPLLVALYLAHVLKCWAAPPGWWDAIWLCCCSVLIVLALLRRRIPKTVGRLAIIFLKLTAVSAVFQILYSPY